MAKCPYTVEKNIIMVGPFQYRVQIRKRGFKVPSETFETLDGAINNRDSILNSIREGTYKDASEAKHRTLGYFLGRYIDEVATKITTTDKYCRQLQSRLRCIKNREIGSVPMFELAGIHLRFYREQRKVEVSPKTGKTISRKTLKEEFSEISRVIEYACLEWDLHLPSGNPVNVNVLMKHIANDAKQRQPIRSDDIEGKLLSACKEYGDKHTLYNLVDLGLRTGLRRTQLVELLWENIYIDEHIAHVKNKNEKRDGQPLVAVKLSAAAVTILNRIGFKTSGKVFFYTSPDTVTKAFGRIRKKDEFKDIPEFEFITPHTLRHTAVHRLKKAGTDRQQAKLVTGHQSDQMYAHYGKMTAHDIDSAPDI